MLCPNYYYREILRRSLYSRILNKIKLWNAQGQGLLRFQVERLISAYDQREHSLAWLTIKFVCACVLIYSAAIAFLMFGGR